jgi:hypothetical protein
MNAEVPSGGSVPGPGEAELGRVRHGHGAVAFGMPSARQREFMRQRDVSTAFVHLVAAGKLVVSFGGPGDAPRTKVLPAQVATSSTLAQAGRCGKRAFRSR